MVSGWDLYLDYKNAMNRWLYEPSEESDEEHKEAQKKFESWIREIDKRYESPGKDYRSTRSTGEDLLWKLLGSIIGWLEDETTLDSLHEYQKNRRDMLLWIREHDKEDENIEQSRERC